MIISVRNIYGKSVEVNAKPSDSIENVKDKISEKTKIPPDQQRLIYDGRLMENGRALRAYNPEKRWEISLVPHSHGRMNSFVTTEEDNFNSFLLGLTTDQPTNQEFTSRWPNCKFESILLERHGQDLLSVKQMRICKRFLDILWNRYSETNDKGSTADLKVKFLEHEFAERLLGFQCKNDPNSLSELLGKHKRGREGAYVALRRTRGPVTGAIGWHTDEYYATETIQLALNDDLEYDGGRVCYFSTSNGVEVLSRRAGDLTKLGRETLHAVTRLKSGTQYSLFVVDQSNDLGDHTVVCMTREGMEDILLRMSDEEVDVALSDTASMCGFSCQCILL
eukprot:gene10340-11247_t